ATRVPHSSPTRRSSDLGSRIVLRLDSSRGAGDAYALTVRPNETRIMATSPAGVFYGLQTLRQLLPVAIFRRALVPTVKWEARCADRKSTRLNSSHRTIS